MLFVAKSLRDQIRLARTAGVSLDCVPAPREFDDDEMAYDPDSDIRCSRLDRADILVNQALISAAEKSKTAADLDTPSPVVPEPAPSPSPDANA